MLPACKYVRKPSHSDIVSVGVSPLLKVTRRLTESATEHGVPQSRVRTIVLAIRGDLEPNVIELPDAIATLPLPTFFRVELGLCTSRKRNLRADLCCSRARRRQVDVNL